jgi:hypothetical protein
MLMVKIECLKCGSMFEERTKRKAAKELIKHAKKNHSKKDVKKIYRSLRKI